MMHRYQQLWTFVIAMIACAHAHGYANQAAPSAYGPAGSANAAADNVAAASSGDYQLAPGGAAAGASADTAGGNAAAAGPESLSSSSYGSNQNLPYSPANTKGNTVTSSITYPQNKGEILIHRPAPIIVKRPPTKVLVNHPPLVVKPAPVVLHKPPAIVLRKVVVKHHPRPVKVEPVYVNVVKPPAEKYFVNEKQQQYANQYASGPQAYVPQGPVAALPAYASNADTVAANAGYQLLQSNHGIAALANLGHGHGHGHGDGAYAAGPAAAAYGPGPAASLQYGPAQGHGGYNAPAYA